jgi:hypothetical protein
MVNLFEAIVIAVAVAGIVLAVTVGGPLGRGQDLGLGRAWFDHEEDHGFEERPDCSENDPPIPFRPLRARL